MLTNASPRFTGPFVRQPSVLSHIPGSCLGAFYLRLQRCATLDGFLEFAHLHHHLVEGVQAPLYEHERGHLPSTPAGYKLREGLGEGPDVDYEQEPVSVKYPFAEKRTQHR